MKNLEKKFTQLKKTLKKNIKNLKINGKKIIGYGSPAKATTALIFFGISKISFADGHAVYGPYPITLNGYTGDKTNSVKYTGQMARHALHDSLKALVKTGDVTQMLAYYNGEDGLKIIAPKSKKCNNIFT